jgi:hypothetical protein
MIIRLHPLVRAASRAQPWRCLPAPRSVFRLRSPPVAPQATSHLQLDVVQGAFASVSHIREEVEV